MHTNLVAPLVPLPLPWQGHQDLIQHVVELGRVPVKVLVDANRLVLILTKLDADTPASLQT